MDVRLVVPELGPQTGGIGRYVTELQGGLVSQKIDAKLARFRYPPGANRRTILRSIPIGVEDATSSSIVHLTRIQGASMLLFRRPQASVVTVHDLGALLCPEDEVITNPIDRMLLRLSLAGMRRAGRIIAVSEFTKQCLVKHLRYDADHVDVVPLGVDHGVFRPKQGARASLNDRFGLNISNEAAIILYVGSELPRKGLATLVQALSRLQYDGIQLHFIKVGRAGYQAGREQLMRLLAQTGLQAHTTILEDIPNKDLAILYSAADVYAHPSVWEGFGLPVLEAMACGAPVVASNAASLPEVTGSAGLLFDPHNVDALVSALRRVLAQPDLAAHLSESGQSRARDFTWRRTAERTVESYQSLHRAAPSVHARPGNTLDGARLE
jgi:glycosyltransferase involved in cell wall biosynthesis